MFLNSFIEADVRAIDGWAPSPSGAFHILSFNLNHLMRTIPPERFKVIVDKGMTENAELMRRLAAFEAISHLPFEWVRPPERNVPETSASSNCDATSEGQQRLLGPTPRHSQLQAPCSKLFPMNSTLHKSTVLVLNKCWQAIDTKTPAQAF